MPDTSAVTNTVTDVVGKMTLMSLLYTLGVLVACLVAIKIVLTILRKVLAKSKLDARVAGYVVSIVKAALIIIAILVVADQLGIPITSLIALLSVLSLAVTLAVQTVLSNVAGGLVILATKPFAVGDFVSAGGSDGTVAEIHLTHTCLDSPGGLRIILPNGSLAGDKVVNYTRLGRRRVEVTVTASYDAPVQSVREAMLEAAARCDKVLPDPAPAVMVSKYGESSIEYLIHCWCDAADYWGAYFPLVENIKTCFDEKGVEMTYDHLNVHIVEKK